MKYKDPVTGELKDIYVKASDTLPVGAVVDYDGEDIPAGWEQVEDSVTVVESGSNENGSWIKWSDGKMICEGTWEIGEAQASTKTESVYKVDITSRHSFPVPFIEKPRMMFTPYEFVEDWGLLLWVCPKKASVTATDFGNFNVVSASQAYINLAIDYIAIGKWK